MAPSEYPNWLPPAVAAEAWELSQGFGADPEIAAAIERLVTCEKMRSVWRELLKRRKAGGYLHPARRTPEHPADLDDNALQAQALRHVFGNAAVMVRAALPAVTAAEFKRNLAKSVETERRFRWVAEVVEGHNNNPELVAALIQESDFFARGRESYRQLGFPVVERHRSDAKTARFRFRRRFRQTPDPHNSKDRHSRPWAPDRRQTGKRRCGTNR